MDVYDAGVDWLTMTWDVKSDKTHKAFNLIRDYQEQIATEGFDVVEAKWNNYEGKQCGAVFVGVRPDGMLLKVSGADSKVVAKLLKDADADEKATRIDFQTTAKTADSNERVLRGVCEKVRRAAEGRDGFQPRNTADYRSRGRCTGMVVGARSSENYFRIYDKSAEQKGRVEKGLIRFEGEFKQGKARQAWRKYKDAPDEMQFVLSLTRSEFERLGADMKWLKADEQIQFVSEYRGTSAQKKLAWLERFVRPSVEWLFARGFRDEVYIALGLEIPR